MIWIFKKVPGGLVSIFLESKNWQERAASLGLLRTKAISVPQSPLYYRQKLDGRQVPHLLLHHRGHSKAERSKSRVSIEIGKPLQLLDYTHKPKVCVRLKMSLGSVAGLIIESSPCMKPVHKNWERWLIFQMLKSQQKTTGHTKNRETLAIERSKLNLIPTLMK